MEHHPTSSDIVPDYGDTDTLDTERNYPLTVKVKNFKKYDSI